jgi:hypothetical protein
MMASGSPDVWLCAQCGTKIARCEPPSFENLASVIQLDDTRDVESSRSDGDDHFASLKSDLNARGAIDNVMG